MKKILFSTDRKNTLDVGLLFLRVGFGLLMIPHGWSKLMKFEELQVKFMNFMGIGSSVSLGLVVFSELICSLLLILGLMTRWATIPLIITALVISSVHQWDLFGESELGSTYLIAYLVILFTGPGKYSLDQLFFKKSRKSYFK